MIPFSFRQEVIFLPIIGFVNISSVLLLRARRFCHNFQLRPLNLSFQDSIHPIWFMHFLFFFCHDGGCGRMPPLGDLSSLSHLH